MVTSGTHQKCVFGRAHFVFNSLKRSRMHIHGSTETVSPERISTFHALVVCLLQRKMGVRRSNVAQNMPALYPGSVCRRNPDVT